MLRAQQQPTRATARRRARRPRSAAGAAAPRRTSRAGRGRWTRASRPDTSRRNARRSGVDGQLRDEAGDDLLRPGVEVVVVQPGVEVRGEVAVEHVALAADLPAGRARLEERALEPERKEEREPLGFALA